jgi:hypothetical protein
MKTHMGGRNEREGPKVVKGMLQTSNCENKRCTMEDWDQSKAAENSVRTHLLPDKSDQYYTQDTRCKDGTARRVTDFHQN